MMENFQSDSNRNWALARRDLYNGLRSWEMWTLLGVSDIRQRYKRSKVGQLWITLSLGLFIATIGIVYSQLFGMQPSNYLPYVAVNMVIWTFISGVVTDSTDTFVQASIYLRQDAFPRTIFALRVIARNIIIFSHNFLILPFVFLLFGFNLTWANMLFIPGMIILIIAAFAFSLGCAVISTRFRDLPQIIQSLLQIAFFATPIMWQPGQMSGKIRIVVEFNPFAAFLQIVAEPIRGNVPATSAYIVAITTTIMLYMIVLPLFARFRARIVYWI